MRPVPIDEGDVWPGHQRVTMGPPRGHDITGDIRSVDVMVAELTLNGETTHAFTSRIELEDGDLERLAAGEPFYVTLYGLMVPFDVAMTTEPL